MHSANLNNSIVDCVFLCLSIWQQIDCWLCDHKYVQLLLCACTNKQKEMLVIGRLGYNYWSVIAIEKGSWSVVVIATIVQPEVWWLRLHLLFQFCTFVLIWVLLYKINVCCNETESSHFFFWPIWECFLFFFFFLLFHVCPQSSVQQTTTEELSYYTVFFSACLCLGHFLFYFLPTRELTDSTTHIAYHIVCVKKTSHWLPKSAKTMDNTNLYVSARALLSQIYCWWPSASPPPFLSGHHHVWAF